MQLLRFFTWAVRFEHSVMILLAKLVIAVLRSQSNQRRRASGSTLCGSAAIGTRHRDSPKYTCSPSILDVKARLCHNRLDQ